MVNSEGIMCYIMRILSDITVINNNTSFGKPTPELLLSVIETIMKTKFQI